jgi:hypothetical protein
MTSAAQPDNVARLAEPALSSAAADAAPGVCAAAASGAAGGDGVTPRAAADTGLGATQATAARASAASAAITALLEMDSLEDHAAYVARWVSEMKISVDTALLAFFF